MPSRKGVFDGIAVKILVDVVASIMTAAGGFRHYWPRVFHPAAFVDVVDQEIAVCPAAGPEEGMESLDLVKQLTDAFGLGLGECRGRRSRHAVGAEQHQLADLAVANPGK